MVCVCVCVCVYNASYLIYTVTKQSLFAYSTILCNIVIVRVFMVSMLSCSKPPAAAKSLQSYSTLCDPIDSSPPGSPTLGFSRQGHWSGLPFPSPMHGSEKWKGSRSFVSDSQRPHGLQPTRLLRLWDSPGKSTEVGCHCLLRFQT